MSNITDMASMKTSDTLRLLAKQIDENKQPLFFLVVDREDGTIASAYNDGEGSYMLLGAIEAEKQNMMDGI